jgi:hypothetical protein
MRTRSSEAGTVKRDDVSEVIRQLAESFDPRIRINDCEVLPARNRAMPDCYYGRLPHGLRDLATEAVRYLQQRGFIVQWYDKPGRIILTPIVYVEPPAKCYHATPLANRARIEAEGIMCARLSGNSMSGRQDCADYIHVCLTRQNCQRWLNEVFPSTGIGMGDLWAIFEIDMSRLGARVFRDPASSTGYIVEADWIPRECVRYTFAWD